MLHLFNKKNQSGKNTSRKIGRYLLAATLLLPGVGHLSFARKQFQAQVPDWIPMDKDQVVVLSGFAELALGAALLALPSRQKELGIVTASYFTLIFPGNIAQFVNRTNEFGLDSDLSRGIRLGFQPLLVLLALWSTGALKKKRIVKG